MGDMGRGTAAALRMAGLTLDRAPRKLLSTTSARPMGVICYPISRVGLTLALLTASLVGGSDGQVDIAGCWRVTSGSLSTNRRGWAGNAHYIN